jgi:hypothetical protein
VALAECRVEAVPEFAEGTAYRPQPGDPPPVCIFCGESEDDPYRPDRTRFLVGPKGAICQRCARELHGMFERWEQREMRDPEGT